jgi:hypothetical protein
MRSLLAAIIASLLVGCSNFEVIKHNQQAKVGTVVLTPTGALQAKNELAKAYEAKAYEVLTEAVKTHLPPQYRQKMVVNSRSETNVKFWDWFGSNQVNITGAKFLGDDDLYIDYGFQRIGLVHYVDLSVVYAEADMGVLFIDPKTGEVIGRAMTWGIRQYGGELIARLNDDVIISNISAKQIEDAFNRLINRLVAEAIGKITGSQ